MSGGAATDSPPASPRRSRLERYTPHLLLVLGLAAGTFLHWPALTHFAVYKEDMVQSPHWVAYHATSFRDDDPVLAYARFNESPLQNALYWSTTWLADGLLLSKVLAVLSYGLLALVFFLAGRAMYGYRFGVLLALFITLLPDQWEFSAGFFSKFWAIPLLLLCVLVLETRRFAGLVALLPFAALAYPTAAVLIGMTASVQVVQEGIRDRAQAARLLRSLASGSVLAVALLSVKYVSPPSGIGPMRPGSELRAMPELREGGYPSHYIPIPSLATELAGRLGHPFPWLSAACFVLLLRRRMAWERSWTSLLVASVLGYVLADLLFMRLYIPNRFTRYSLPVLLALFQARNWDLVLGQLANRRARWMAASAVIAIGLVAHALTFEPGRGYTDKREVEGVCRYIRERLPEKALVAGSPRRLDDVMLQARRSVLCPYKLAHPWFVTYYDAMRERTRATLSAHFASRPEELDELSRRYGVTHFLVEKALFARAREERQLYAEPYSREVYEALAGRRRFLLESPPPEWVLWQDARYALLALPVVPIPPAAGSR